VWSTHTAVVCSHAAADMPTPHHVLSAIHHARAIATPDVPYCQIEQNWPEAVTSTTPV
jgi:hypothetical protein